MKHQRIILLAALVIASGWTLVGGAAYAEDAEDVGPDPAKLRATAEEGDALAQAHLANLYFDGYRVDQDYAEAARWYLAAALQGQAFAQWRLGGMYRDGEGVEVDPVAAYAWLSVAAANTAPLGVGLGDLPAIERGQLAALMTPRQIVAAQDMARELWVRIEDTAGST